MMTAVTLGQQRLSRLQTRLGFVPTRRISYRHIIAIKVTASLSAVSLLANRYTITPSVIVFCKEAKFAHIETPGSISIVHPPCPAENSPGLAFHPSKASTIISASYICDRKEGEVGVSKKFMLKYSSDSPCGKERSERTIIIW